MSCDNVNAVPERQFLGLQRMSADTLEVMRGECADELALVYPALRELAAKRNGLKAISDELARRGYASEAGEALASTYQHGKSDLSLLPPAGSK